MSTTTPTAVRSALATIIRGLTPTTHAGDKFIEHREELPIESWASDNPAGCLRRYSVRWIGPLRGPYVSDQRTEFVNRDIDILIAYPTSWRGGGLQLAGLDDVISEDLRKINNAVGTNGHAAIAAALTPASVTSITSVDDGEEVVPAGPVHFGIVRLRPVHYFRSMT